jgi:ribonuclease Z
LQITFLGTSSGVPTRARNVSAVALRLPQRAEWWLFDCGEGTQHQILRSDLRVSQLTRIFITHMHGDHIYGLMGLLSTVGLAGNARPINVYGPPGLADYLRAAQLYSHTDFSNRVEVETIGNDASVVCEDGDFTVECRPLRHRVPAWGYRVTERDHPGSFNVEKAFALGIPAGPLYGRLKRGERVTLPDGREIDGAELCSPPEQGRRIAYCTDTIYSEGAIELARGADVLIHEATFAEEDAELALQSMHSTATVAAHVAAVAQVKSLILTHFSARYVPGNSVEPDDLLRQARAVFPNTRLAHDFLTIEVARHRAPSI